MLKPPKMKAVKSPVLTSREWSASRFCRVYCQPPGAVAARCLFVASFVPLQFVTSEVCSSGIELDLFGLVMDFPKSYARLAIA